MLIARPCPCRYDRIIADPPARFNRAYCLARLGKTRRAKDEFEAIADEFIDELEAVGLRARPNEPYSGQSHVVTSAQTHGRRHGRVYFEIEINQRLLGRQIDAARMGRRLAPVFARVGTAARNLSGAPGGV